MKILITLDSFKGSCGSIRAGEAVARGIREALPNATCTVLGIADGGEGTAEIILRDRDGSWIPRTTMGPLPDFKVESGYAHLRAEDLYIVEMACSSGLHLMQNRPLQALKATTYGTGECIRALASSVNQPNLMLSVGGSATTDGGTGAAAACGWRFLDVKGEPLPLGGGVLRHLHRIEPPSEPLQLGTVEVLCDVTNPLLGPWGSASIYGPQKGASAEDIEILEEGLSRLREQVSMDLGVEMNVPGGGAAGGLSAGAVAFFGAVLKPGIQTLMNLMGLNDHLKPADWLITGEGRLDSQSLSGKVIYGLLDAAKTHGTPVAVIAGQSALTQKEWEDAGIHSIYTLMQPGDSLEESMQRAEERLVEAGRKWAEDHV